MTYDQWKTHSPDDDAPVCDACGGWLHRGTRFELYCPDCEADAIEAREQVQFYEWEPESSADARDGCEASGRATSIAAATGAQ